MSTEVIYCTRVKRKNLMSDDPFLTLIANEVKFSHELNITDAGPLSVQQLDIVADIEPDIAIDLQGQPQQFIITDSIGDEFTWGDNTYKVRCVSCNRRKNHTRISFMRKSPKLEF